MSKGGRVGYENVWKLTIHQQLFRLLFREIVAPCAERRDWNSSTDSKNGHPGNF